MTGLRQSLASLTLALLPAVFFNGGCAFHTPATNHRAQHEQNPPDIDWPQRWTDDLAGIAAALPRTYYGRRELEFAPEEDQLVVAGPNVDPDEFEHDQSLHEPTVDYRIERPFSFTSEPQVHGVGIVRETWIGHGRDARNRSLRFLSWIDQPDMDAIEDDSINGLRVTNGTAATLAMPTGNVVRGLAVTLGPHVKSRWELAEILPCRGWARLSIGFAGTADRQMRNEFALPLTEDLTAHVREVAEELDQQLADYAYAVEAFLSYVRANIPELADVPMVVIGNSRGALAVPTIVARNAHLVNAAVLMIGGANLAEIALTTSWRDQNLLRFSWHDGNGRPGIAGPAHRELLNHTYLHHSRLDPYHTAPHVAHLPVLVIDAIFDAIIRRSNGNLLYERLGRPERWSYPLGHGVTFWLLNHQSERIIEWFDRAVAEHDPSTR